VDARTLYQVLSQTSDRYGDAPALRQPASAGAWVTYSWNQYRRAAEEIAAGLRMLGLGRGAVVALDSETRLEFYLADMGILANGGIAAALYPTYPASELKTTLAEIGAQAAFAEDPKTWQALRDAPVRHWILLTGAADGTLTLDGLREMGRAALDRDPSLADAIRGAARPADPALLYLTSGATGEPKKALVTHQAVVANLEMGRTTLPLGPHDRTIAFLPSAHIAQRVVMEFFPVRCGMPVTFSESLLKLPQEIRAVRPTILLAPPRLWERIYASICTELKKRPAAVRKAFYSGLALALAAARYRRQGQTVPARIRVPLAVADRLLFRAVRARFGGRLRIAASGAAPLGKELAEFYEAIGLPLIEGYGLTEGGVVTMNPLDAPQPGSIGKPLPGVEVRLADDGELLVKSPSLFSGYLQDPEATAEVLSDGWLRTGDLALVDDRGYLFITGRKKELIVSSTGKKIFPARVESLFKMEPIISQVLLIGDRRPYLTALITINVPAAAELKGMGEWRQQPVEIIAQAPPVLDEVQKTVARVNRRLAPFEQIRRYHVLGRDFSLERGELTATMKVRRAQALENFKDSVSELYAGRE